MPRRLIKIDGIWHYRRRIPVRFRDVDPRRFAKVSLETRDLSRAEKMKAAVERELESYWIALKRGGSESARERYIGAIERARLEGFEFRPAAELVQDPVAELVARIERLEELGALTLPSSGDVPAPTPAERQAFDALFGTAPRPELTLSSALEQFEALTFHDVSSKSGDQIRKWRNVRIASLQNLIAQIGDKPITQVTRTDALAFRAWWQERVVQEGYARNTANKQIGFVAQILETLNDKLELGMGKPFARLLLKDTKTARRAAFTVEQLRALADGGLAGLNDEARDIVLTMIETGMRPAEICGLEEEDVILDGRCPFVKIRPKPHRQLKTPELGTRHAPGRGLAGRNAPTPRRLPALP